MCVRTHPCASRSRSLGSSVAPGCVCHARSARVARRAQVFQARHGGCGGKVGQKVAAGSCS
eukprot:4948231-Alexandrium_andersonii.AAC.1